MSQDKHGSDAAPALLGASDQLPWNVATVVHGLAKPTDFLLDIGCGPAAKLREIAPAARRVYALDCHAGRLAQAAANLRAWGIANVELLRGHSQRLPFADDTFDLVTCMTAPHHAREIWRVLKPGGWTVLEKVGEGDKESIKAEFGKDEQGWRGFLSNQQAGERQRFFQAEFVALFRSVALRAGGCRYDCFSLDQLIDLLEQVSLVRGFDRTRDAAVLERFKKKILMEGRIESRQERILIQAQK